MAAPKLDIVKDEDGGYSLVSEVEGITVTFGRVNPSQLSEAAAAQGKNQPDLPTGDDAGDEA